MHYTIGVNIAEFFTFDMGIPTTEQRHDRAFRQWPIERFPGGNIIGGDLGIGVGFRLGANIDDR